ncbi:MAG: S-layer homology domain-containing protein [Candidatus Peregrinibacteria bacterium]|nr:S-layer homology domain-containing protein [Candidatus Peregrinibacteria bacterium]MDZ4244573.1 S-layer homology domain-containing protein [Candidatus Gracilibacteria bacterium]
MATILNCNYVKRVIFTLLATLSISLLFSLTTAFAVATTYTVDTTTYDDDGECVIDTSLLDAIGCAGDNPGQDTIEFGVSGTITITNPDLILDPTDTEGIILDCGGITFDGGAIDGPQTIGPSKVKGCIFSGFNNALTVNGAGATVGEAGSKNVFINWGDTSGNYAITVAADNVTVKNNWIGTDGATAMSGYAGIIVQNSTDSVIGGSTASERNVIAGNGESGSCGVTIGNNVGDLTISGNYIGIGTDGATGLGGIDGICTSSSQTYSGSIIIGGPTTGYRNIISGNTSTGIHLGDSIFSNLQIVNNYIGTNAYGTAAIATFGYTQDTAGIYFNGAGSAVLGDSVIQRNLISGNENNGIYLTSLASNWQITNNKIGTNAAGTSAIANGQNGIACFTCVNNIFGTTDTDAINEPNTISGNGSHGIYIGGNGSTGNLISENHIGLNEVGDGAIANGSMGVLCNACGALTIGNSGTANTMNAIAGNTDDGIVVNSSAGAVGIYANGIGVNGGGSRFANGGSGIRITGTPTAVITIGNTAATGGNLISGNTARGIHINDAGSQSHVIKGNRIGTNKNADGVIGNDFDGILIEGSNPNITVGSAVSGQYNIIGGNGVGGVTVTGSGIAATIIGNYIGTNTSFEDLGNTGDGVLINAGATGAILGYGFAETLTGLDKANYIGYNGGNDVTLDGSSTTTNSLRGNIFEVAAADTSANMVFNPGAQSGVTNASVSTTVTDVTFTLSLTGLADGSKVDWYTIDGSYTTTFEGTSTVADETATLSGSFTIGDTACYQITLANGTSYPIACAGAIISDVPTGLTTFSITNSNGSLLASWSTVSSTIFDHYEVWYGTNQTDVENRNGTAEEWDDSDDALLATVGTTSTTIIDEAVTLNIPGITYYAKIWAYNTTGGNSTLSAASYFTGISGGSTASSTPSTTTSEPTVDETTDETTQEEIEELAEEEEDQAAEDLATEEQMLEEKIDDAAIDNLLKEIEEKLDEENLWMKRHFKNLMQLKNMQRAYSTSKYIHNLVDDFYNDPSQLMRNGEAIVLATAVFTDISSREKLVYENTSLPFVKASFERGVLNKIVDGSFNSKAQLKRGNALRLMFRVSGARLHKKFGKSLWENFGVGGFTDVGFSDPYLPHILYFQMKGLLQGYADGTFRSSDFISRAEFVKLISMFAIEMQR